MARQAASHKGAFRLPFYYHHCLYCCTFIRVCLVWETTLRGFALVFACLSPEYRHRGDVLEQTMIKRQLDKLVTDPSRLIESGDAATSAWCCHLRLVTDPASATSRPWASVVCLPSPTHMARAEQVVRRASSRHRPCKWAKQSLKAMRKARIARINRVACPLSRGQAVELSKVTRCAN